MGYYTRIMFMVLCNLLLDYTYIKGGLMPVKTIINGTEVLLNDCERQECEVWSRVMGYYRPVSEWNIGKQQEFKDRHMYSEKQFTKEGVSK